MEEDSRIPFDDILSSLFADEMGPINQLYRLSDMDEKEQTQFRARWYSVSDDRRQEIVRHLADISESNFIVDFSPIFRVSFQDSYAPVRVAALDGLWDSTDSTLVEPILKLLLGDPAPEVRAAAARSLAHFILMSEWGQINGVNTTMIFDSLLDTYNDPETTLPVRCAALEAMGPAASPNTSRLITDAYEGHEFELQVSAIFAMGTSADPRWLSILLDEMESPREEMRAEAARAAGIIGHSEAIPQLAELAFDDDLDVATSAVTAIAQIGGDDGNRILDDLLLEPHAVHLHETIEEALEEAVLIDPKLPFFPWSEDDLENDK